VYDHLAAPLGREAVRTLYGVPVDTMSSAVITYEAMDDALNTGRMACTSIGCWWADSRWPAPGR